MDGAAALAPGFADPVGGAQACFRATLEAMARPGLIAALAAPPATPDGLSPAQAAIALTLADFETPVWLDPTCAAAAGWLRFHAGSPVVDSPAAARFAFARGFGALPRLADFALGSAEFPDRSTTLVIEVDALAADDGLVLRGPGIRDVHRLAATGVPAAFWAERVGLVELVPRGVDLILTCGARLVALPRTTRVEA